MLARGVIMKTKLIALTIALMVVNATAAQLSAEAYLNKHAQDKTTAHKVSAPVQSITKSEAKAARMAVIVENFEKIDANNDGVVTRKELRAYVLSTRRHVPMT
jgi:Ca2+-binding EF-hand superfamily protein